MLKNQDPVEEVWEKVKYHMRDARKKGGGVNGLNGA